MHAYKLYMRAHMAINVLIQDLYVHQYTPIHVTYACVHASCVFGSDKIKIKYMINSILMRNVLNSSFGFNVFRLFGWQTYLRKSPALLHTPNAAFTNIRCGGRKTKTVCMAQTTFD